MGPLTVGILNLYLGENPIQLKGLQKNHIIFIDNKIKLVIFIFIDEYLKQKFIYFESFVRNQ